MTLSAFFEKTFASQKSQLFQAGQAVVEYLLVLIVTVSLIMGVLYQFNDAFKNFLDSYFGDYIACLLETGELPALGGDGPNQTECNAGFENFSLANGRPAKGSNYTPGGSSSSSSSENGSSSGSSGSDSSSDSNSKSLRPSSFTSSNAPTNSEASARARNRGRPGRQVVSGNQQQAGDATGLGSDSSEGGLAGRRGNIVKKRVIYLSDDYLTPQAKEKRKKKVLEGKKSKAQREKENLRKAQFEFEPPQPKRAIAEEEESGFSLALLLKFVLIAGIIIILVIFLGGQALSIKKSWQKSE